MYKSILNAVGVVAAVAAVMFAGCDGNSGVDPNDHDDPNNLSVKKETFTDSRDGTSYKWVEIGTQKWMAENLNYNASGSKCYENSAGNCAKYGRLYYWSTAMNGASSSNLSPSGVQGVCPAGWHLPSGDEWTTLTYYVGSGAGTKLKSASGWNNNSQGVSGNGTDDFGWSALPGGGGGSDGSFRRAGNYGYWWGAEEHGGTGSGIIRWMGYTYDEVEKSGGEETDLFSVRCVQD